MKFSWKILNHLVDLKKITLNIFTTKLTLAGFEIEKIDKTYLSQDIIIDIDITSNRQDISSVSQLAQEVSIIFNIPLKQAVINFKKLVVKKEYTQECITKLPDQFKYIKIHRIINLINNKSPLWIKNILISYDIRPKNLLHDVTQYIRIKWGQEILLLQENKPYDFSVKYITKQLNNIQKIHCNTQHIEHLILCFPVYHSSYIDHDNFLHSYYESIRLITTFGDSIVSKSYNLFNSKYNRIEDSIKQISIRKDKIQKLLGPNLEQKSKLLSQKSIIYILHQLKLKPIYDHRNKRFRVNIPKSRILDLERQIDVIEEIGRIHGFKNFLSTLPNNTNKGLVSSKSLTIHKISYTLQNIGLHEVINSSLNKNTSKSNISIGPFNPIIEDQKQLRNNIIDNLIANYRYNIKQKNSKIEIFEIGKIFCKDEEDKSIYLEKLHLGGIIYNENYLRKTWSDKPEEINWYYAKGILEFFLEKLKIPLDWTPLKNQDIDFYIKEQVQHFLHPTKQVSMYSPVTKTHIGLFGQLNKQYTQSLNTKNANIYIFEIDIDKLNTLISSTKHLKYVMKYYSPYPSVIRDVNINIIANQNLNKIKNILLNQNQDLIDSIEIINEYYNTILKMKSVCLRITYRAYNRTLNNNDLININNNIHKSLQVLNQE